MTETERYNVVLQPQIKEGHEPDSVAQAFAELFKISTEKAGKIIGTKRILKKNIELAKANNYRQKLSSIGLHITLEKIAMTPTVAQPSKPKHPMLELVPTEEELAAEQEAQSAQSETGASASATIVCPKCQLQQPKAGQCSGCGIYFHKVTDPAPIDSHQAARQVRHQTEEPVEDTSPWTDRDSPPIKKYLIPAVAALLGALLWKFIAVTFNFELGLIAWLIGGAIGYSAAMAGASGQNTAAVCAILALMAIFGGKYMATSSLISDATAAINNADETGELALKTIYEVLQSDATYFSETVTDEESLRAFMVERDYSSAADAGSVTEEEIEQFKTLEQPQLEELLNNPQSYEDWKNNTLATTLENMSTLDIMMENLGLLDIVFLFLGIGTAYRLGMGNE